MATTGHILRILCLSVLVNLIHFSMSLENDSPHSSQHQVLCPAHVGVFYPDLPDLYGPGPVIAVGSDIVYRDIYTWVDMLNELANISSTKDITQAIQPCLRGSAAIWWIVELTGEERGGLREASLKQWSSTLTERFGLPPHVAFDKLENSWYTTQDLDKPPRIWIQQMVHFAKAAEIHPGLQVYRIWLQFDDNLRSCMYRPTVNTTLMEFLAQVDERYPALVMRSQGAFGGFPPSNSPIPGSNSGLFDHVANAVRRLI